ncbi:hypothetical protein ADUPG1_001441, partial [Aduncisulcus paluster]
MVQEIIPPGNSAEHIPDFLTVFLMGYLRHLSSISVAVYSIISGKLIFLLHDGSHYVSVDSVKMLRKIGGGNSSNLDKFNYDFLSDLQSLLLNLIHD